MYENVKSRAKFCNHYRSYFLYIWTIYLEEQFINSCPDGLDLNVHVAICGRYSYFFRTQMKNYSLVWICCLIILKKRKQTNKQNSHFQTELIFTYHQSTYSNFWINLHRRFWPICAKYGVFVRLVLLNVFICSSAKRYLVSKNTHKMILYMGRLGG